MKIKENITFTNHEGVGNMVNAFLLAHIHDKVKISIEYEGNTVSFVSEIDLNRSWELEDD